MYKDSKKYLKNYWKELVVIALSIFAFSFAAYAALFISYDYYDEYVVPHVSLTTCTNFIYDYGTYTGEQNEKEYNLLGILFNKHEDYKNPDGCKYSKEELDQGLDKIYKNNFEKLITYLDFDKKLNDRTDFLDSIGTADQDKLGDAEFLLKYKASSSAFLSSEIYDQLKTKKDFYIEMYKVKLDLVDQNNTNLYQLLDNLNKEEIRSAIHNAGVAMAKKYWLANIGSLVLLMLAFILLSFLLQLFAKLFKNKYLRLVILTFSAIFVKRVGISVGIM
jgi:hypothetical protein